MIEPKHQIYEQDTQYKCKKEIKSIINNVNRRKADVSYSEEQYLLYGDDFITESEADGRNIHSEIVRGMNAKSINRYPSSKKLESDKKIKPINSDNKHNLNLKDGSLFLKI